MNSVTLGPLVFETGRFASLPGIASLFVMKTLADWLEHPRLHTAGPARPPRSWRLSGRWHVEEISRANLSRRMTEPTGESE